MTAILVNTQDTIDPRARAAHAWLQGYSDRRAGTHPRSSDLDYRRGYENAAAELGPLD